MNQKFKFSGEERQNKGNMGHNYLLEYLEKWGYKVLKNKQEGIDLLVEHNDKNLQFWKLFPSPCLILLSTEDKVTKSIVKKDIAEIKKKSQFFQKKFQNSNLTLVYLSSKYNNTRIENVNICNERNFNFYVYKTAQLKILKNSSYSLIKEILIEHFSILYTSLINKRNKLFAEVVIFYENENVLDDTRIKKILQKVKEIYNQEILNDLDLNIKISIITLRMHSEGLDRRIFQLYKEISKKNLKFISINKNNPITNFEFPCKIIGGIR